MNGLNFESQSAPDILELLKKLLQDSGYGSTGGGAGLLAALNEAFNRARRPAGGLFGGSPTQSIGGAGSTGLIVPTGLTPPSSVSATRNYGDV